MRSQPPGVVPMFRTPVRSAAGLLVACSAAFAASPALADWPDKPIPFVAPFSAGGANDLVARIIAKAVGTTLNQTGIVENRPGAGGNIGASEVARAAPDGYTLLMGTNGTHVLNQYMYASTAFDPEKDFEPIMLVSSFPMVLLSPPGSPYANLPDLRDAAKAKSDSVNVGMPSTTARLVCELLQQQGVDSIRGIPYKGSATATTDLMGGQVQIGIDTVSAARICPAAGREVRR
ncbi:hypothetical protein G6F59_014802 [Rhizopus arrhizus]|nr:hypothetical protein G6F59_014802 [Rhizopus arrhizus]